MKTRKQEGRGRVAEKGGLLSAAMQRAEPGRVPSVQYCGTVCCRVLFCSVCAEFPRARSCLPSALLPLVGVRECLSADTGKGLKQQVERTTRAHMVEVIDHVMRLRLCAPVP